MADQGGKGKKKKKAPSGKKEKNGSSRKPMVFCATGKKSTDRVMKDGAEKKKKKKSRARRERKDRVGGMGKGEENGSNQGKDDSGFGGQLV